MMGAALARLDVVTLRQHVRDIASSIHWDAGSNVSKSYLRQPHPVGHRGVSGMTVITEGQAAQPRAWKARRWKKILHDISRRSAETSGRAERQ